MSEKNKNNDQFSNLFKRDDAEFDIPYNEEDWLKLEKKLDLRDAKIAYRRKVALIAAAALLIISFLGYFTYENYVNINQLNRQLDDQITNNGIPPTDNSSRGDSGADQSQEGQSNQTNDPGSSELDENVQNEWSDRNSLNDPDEPSTSVADNTADEFDDEDSERLAVPACSNCMASEISNREVTALLDQSVSTSTPTPTQSQLKLAGNFGLPQLQSADEKKSTGGGSGFSISLKAAPDLSTIDGLSNFQNPGYTLGLDVGYRLNKTISISTGISRSVVRYRGSEGGYNPPGYLTGGVLPNQIIGECIILDIPLNVRFNVLQFSKSRIFATAGVSSYIMLNERYDFKYENSYQQGLNYSYDGNTGTAYLMSNAGLSIGIEVDIHPNWSLRAEPQIKLPLRNVGVSNVRLYSLGSFISLSYKL